MKIEQAILVAAGKSSRLYPRTLERSKVLLEIQGKAILQHSIEKLEKRGVKKIFIVVGYRAGDLAQLRADKADLIFINNPFYEACNNMGSFWFAKPFIEDVPSLFMHSDIVYDSRILQNSMEKFSSSTDDIALVVDYGDVDEEAMKVEVDEHQNMIRSSKEIPPQQSCGEWTGVALMKHPLKVLECFEKILMTGDLNSYDTKGYTQLAQQGEKIAVYPVGNYSWIEIDFEEDYKKALTMQFDA